MENIKMIIVLTGFITTLIIAILLILGNYYVGPLSVIRKQREQIALQVFEMQKKVYILNCLKKYKETPCQY